MHPLPGSDPSGAPPGGRKPTTRIIRLSWQYDRFASKVWPGGMCGRRGDPPPPARRGRPGSSAAEVAINFQKPSRFTVSY
ncbi:hypothetical protein EVAR_65617_1 [Eumeta japonica]|uniref:Uncharacterized protein n=1 Tax=Eumeta variegata TaxID=151549 RepID=A0A4C1Z9D6_EUMVA|nr:hypothetical protein EVAR_65617_1 [Eumeta japonica]